MEKQVWLLSFAWVAMVFSNLFVKKGKNEIRNTSTSVAEVVRWFIAIIMAIIATMMSLGAGVADIISGNGLVSLTAIIAAITSANIVTLTIFKTFYSSNLWTKSHGHVYIITSVLFYGFILISLFAFFIIDTHFSYFSFQ
jgi:magnesium-transporting ATPase (P-type)